MRRETSKTNKTVLELSCRWEAPTSAKQVGVLHQPKKKLGLSIDGFDGLNNIKPLQGINHQQRQEQY